MPDSAAPDHLSVSDLSCDVLIVGGGPAGTATALALHRQGVRNVCVIEQGHYGDMRIGEALPPDIAVLMRRYDLWEDFQREGHQPCVGSCSLWGSDQVGYNDFLFNPHGHGWHLDRRRFDEFLSHQVVRRGLRVELGARFRHAEPHPNGGWRVTVEPLADLNPFSDDVLPLTAPPPVPYRQIRAKVVVDASGPRGCVARQWGGERLLLDRLLFLGTQFDLSSSAFDGRQTMLEAVDYGWWYAAQLPDRKLVVALATDPETLRSQRLVGYDLWRERLAQTSLIGPLVADCPTVHQKQFGAPERQVHAWDGVSFCLQSSVGKASETALWVAVGDAASAYDPISSQGIYKAMVDALDVADVVAAELAGDESEGKLYAQAVRQRFDDYLQNRNYFYAQEQRWPQSSFWLNRQSRCQLEADGAPLSFAMALVR